MQIVGMKWILEGSGGTLFQVRQDLLGDSED
jgi:hypothetical protein